MINRFVHSYWSKPSLMNRWGIDKNIQTITNMWYFATSVAYLKRLGQEIVIHTDDYGKTLLEHIPYDELYLSLNEIPNWMNPALFASGKMIAMKSEELNSVHIDGDVFIKDIACLEKINNINADVIVQSIEKADSYNNTLKAIKHLRFPKNTTKVLDYSYNTGLFSFNNIDFKNKFINTYFDMAETISKSIRCKNAFELDVFVSPDLIIEQKFMYDLSNPYQVGILLEGNVFEESRKLGYQHVLGKDKYPQLSNCKRVLKMLNPELYELCEIKEKEFYGKVK